MVNPKNTSHSRNDSSYPEPPVTTKVGTIRTTNIIKFACPILSLVAISTSMPGVVANLLSIKSVPIFPMTTSTIVGDPNLPYVPSFTMPLIMRDYPYGMPTSMMTGLHSHALMFSDNVVDDTPQSTFGVGSSISNLGRMGKPQGGMSLL